MPLLPTWHSGSAGRGGVLQHNRHLNFRCFCAVPRVGRGEEGKRKNCLGRGWGGRGGGGGLEREEREAGGGVHDWLWSARFL